ncbi:MAG: hypothetical protein JXA20_10585 [Spirochaetes bacterium]|nr:hypothetical protein [Spirochaetota bacterium]
MDTRKRIELKPLVRHDPETLRIFNLTREACGRLNSYLMDFFETVKILKEKREAALSADDRDKVREIDESILFVETTISQVTESMEQIARDMPEYVELLEESAADMVN